MPPVTAILPDAERGYFYITHKADMSLSVVNEKTGEIVKTLKFTHMPERMFLSADGKQLYVALLSQDHSSYVFEDQSGYVAIIDTEALAVVKTLSLNIDPYDLVVTQKGKLIVSSGSGQFTNITAYDVNTGTALGSATIRQASHLTLHPSENWVFSADTDTSPSSFDRFDISGPGITYSGEDPYHGQHRLDGNIWATPDGKYLITRGGDLFSATDMTFVSSLTPPNSSLINVNFNIADAIALLTYDDGSVHVLNLTYLQEIKQLTKNGTAMAANTNGDRAYAFVKTNDTYSISIQQNPCENCAENKPPMASFTYTDGGGNTTSTYNFSAKNSSDPEGSPLTYRWDLDNDGEWDSDFTTNTEAKYKYLLAGAKDVRLQVKDDKGATRIVKVPFTVSQGVDAGIPVANSQSNQLDFNASDFVTDVARSKLYSMDKINKRIYVVDLATGKTEKYFQLDFTPQRLAMAPSGDRLYVALVGTHHGQPDDEFAANKGTSYIATIDLMNQNLIKTTAMQADIFDILVAGDENWVIAAGYGGSGKIRKYSTETGQPIGTDPTPFYVVDSTHIAASHDGIWGYAASGTITKFRLGDINQNGTITSEYDDSNPALASNWVTPDEAYIINGNGVVYSASTLKFVRAMTAAPTTITNVIFDPTNHVAFLMESDNTIDAINLGSLESIKKITPAGTLLGLSAIGKTLYITTKSAAGTISITTQDHPCPNCSTNTAPTAAFKWTPTNGDTTSTFTFDASTSSDAESSPLMYRWDFNNDGTWDTNFSSSPLGTTHYSLSGTRLVKLQIKDNLGAVATSTQAVDVTQGTDFGVTINDSTANTLNFAVNHIVADPTKGKLYITDKNAKRLYIVNAASGLTEKYFKFDFMPDNMTLTADGNRLYVALLTKAHDPFWPEQDQSGYIAVIDLSKSAYVNTFPIEIDPGSIAVTPSGKLIVAPASAQFGALRAYDTKTGKLLGSAGQVYSGSSIILSPTGDLAYVLGINLDKFDLSGDGITFTSATSVTTTSFYFHTLWITPDGKTLISDSGATYSSSTSKEGPRITAFGTGILDVSFDSQNNLAFITASDGNLLVLNTTSMEEVKRITVQRSVIATALINSRLYFINKDAQATTLFSVSHPCSACITNKPPLAAFTVTPDAGDTGTTYVFDSSSSSDPGDTLSYRWDLDGDGVWDTSFTTTATQTKKFTLPGIKTVRVQIKDSSGALALTSQSFLVAQGVDSGVAVNDSEAFTLNFAITNMLVNPTNGKAYFTDSAAKRLYIVDLNSGLTEKYFTLDEYPQRLTLSSDGKKIYVSLSEQAVATNVPNPGYIAVFDTEQQTLINTFAVVGSPFDITAAAGDKVVVSAALQSFQQSLNVYSTATGKQLAAQQVFDTAYLASNTAGSQIYASFPNISFFGIQKFSLSTENIFTQNILSQQPESVGIDFSVTPDGKYLVVNNGDVISSSDATLFKSLGGEYRNAKSVYLDSKSNTVAVLLPTDSVETYSMVDFKLVSTQTIGNADAQRVFIFKGVKNIIEKTSDALKIVPLAMP